MKGVLTMDVIRAMESFEYYQSRTGIRTYAVWLLYRQQTAKAWRMVVNPKIAHKASMSVPEWINSYPQGVKK